MIEIITYTLGLLTFLYSNRDILIISKNVLYYLFMNMDFKRIKNSFRLIIKDILIRTTQKLVCIENYI